MRLPGKRSIQCRSRGLVKADGIQNTFDFFSGTSTSAALYALRVPANACVVCVDRDHNLDNVVDNGYIPSKYLSRYLHIHADVMDLTIDGIWEAVVERWPTAAWEEVCHVHASPSCRSHSHADCGRSRHRDGRGRPCSELARADDRVCTHAIALIRGLQQRVPAALYTIEQPVNKTFCKVPAVAALQRAPAWVAMVAGVVLPYDVRA